METLNGVLRAIRGEAKERREHLSVFREFLSHVDRAARRGKRLRALKRSKPNGKRARR